MHQYVKPRQECNIMH